MPFFTLPRGSMDWSPDLTRLWTDIAGRCGRPDPFCCSPAWQLAFHDAFAPARRLFVHVESGNVLAFALIELPRGGTMMLPLETEWFSGAPLLGPDAVDVLADVLPQICGEVDDLRGILIGGMERDSPDFAGLKALPGLRLTMHPQPSLERCASLEGGMDGYLSRRSGNFRAKMKKARRRAEAEGIRFERHVPADPAQADRLYARMLAVEERSWKGMGSCGMTVEPSRSFYRFMLRRLSRNGCGRVMFAVREGADIGFIFGGIAGSFYRGQQFSYDNAWKRLSVGDLLQMGQIAWLCEEGVRRYDMGMSDHPSMAYKRHWAETELSLHACVMTA